VLAAGLAIVALEGATARAGNISITVTEGALSVQVGLDFGFFGNGTTENNVVANTQALNDELEAQGFSFRFNALGAISSPPGGTGAASLLLTGQVFRVGGNGIGTITIDASQNDYSTLGSLPGILTSFSTSNFVPGGGISQVGTSYFATSNIQNDTSEFSTTAPVMTPPGGSEEEPPLGVPSSSEFSLTSRVVISLPGDTTGGQNPPIDQFTHSSTVTAIPEPAGLVMLGVGMPIGLGCMAWANRRSRSRHR